MEHFRFENFLKTAKKTSKACILIFSNSLNPIILLAAFLAICSRAEAETLTGRPVHLLSGESLILLSRDNVRHKIKLIGLKTEPPASPWGSAARRHLSMLVAGKPVTVQYQHRDKLGNILGRLVTGGLDINLRMIRDGLARHSPTHQSEQERNIYAATEQQARKAQLGLWKRQNQHRRPRFIHLPGVALP